jgi:acyl-CoA reductase-like NAD-dependent aldehyde dehydrogenase
MAPLEWIESSAPLIRRTRSLMPFHVFRGAMPNIRVVQEADGRVPMIVEYDALDGSSVREFIQGSLVNSGRCSYIAVTRIVAVDDLPSGYQVTEMLIEVRFDEED